MDQLCFKKICHWFHLRCLVVFNWNDWSKAVITCGLFWCTWDNPSHPRVFLAFCVCAPVSWHSSSYDFSLSEYRQGQDRKKDLFFSKNILKHLLIPTPTTLPGVHEEPPMWTPCFPSCPATILFLLGNYVNQMMPFPYKTRPMASHHIQ